MTKDPITFEQLEQDAGQAFRTGRHLLHDAASRAFDALALLPAEAIDELGRAKLPTAAVMHEQFVQPWDQGRVGSCTANAALGLLVSGPFWRESYYTEQDAQDLYRTETRLDDRQIPGSWEPDDTGSTGLWSMKALRNQGLIRSYHHAFSTRTVLALLAHYPVSIGVRWYESMFTPDRDHVIQVDTGSQVAGGHQIALVGVDPAREVVRVRNSWGTGWGDGGFAWLLWPDLDSLLHSGGDAVVPVIA